MISDHEDTLMNFKVPEILCSIVALSIAVILTGCTYTGTVKPGGMAEEQQPRLDFPETKSIPLNVGLHLGEDLRKYVYKSQKTTMTLQMNVGESVALVSKQMASKMFNEAALVDSLPPYTDGYRPDVEAVVEPEILFFHGDATGTASGHIEAVVKMRITAYDLAGKILWQDEAVGKGRSGQVNLIGTFLTGTEEARKTAYQAVFNAATGVINDFNDKPPRDLHSLVETEKIPTLTNQRNISNFVMFKEYYEKGQFQFKRKNFHQALRSFKQAESVDPGDLSTKFYVGVCLFYTAQRDKAVEKFRHVVKQGPNTQEAKDSAKWLDLLKEPLKIGTVVLGIGRGARDPVMMPDENPVNTTIRKSSMYELVNLAELKPPVDVAQTKNLDQYLEMSAKNGAAIILYITVTDLTSRIPIQHKSSGEIADEFSMRLDTKVFSTRKKQKRTEIVVTEGTSTLFYKKNQEEGAIKEQLLKRGTEKLILRLLENEIF